MKYIVVLLILIVSGCSNEKGWGISGYSYKYKTYEVKFGEVGINMAESKVNHRYYTKQRATDEFQHELDKLATGVYGMGFYLNF